MQRSFLFGVIGLVLGLVIGFFGANSLNRDMTSSAVSASTDASISPERSGASQAPDVTELLSRAEREPQNFALQMRTGDMYAKIGRFDQAIAFYSKGVVLKPTDFFAQVALANAYFDSAQFEKAADHYQKAVEINPRDADARADLAATFVERADPDHQRAIKELDAALDLDSGHAPALYYLAIAYQRTGSPAEAQKTLSRLEQANPGSALIDRLRKNLAAAS
jgi:tetratricopeptide (TPR) repeat protein